MLGSKALIRFLCTSSRCQRKLAPVIQGEWRADSYPNIKSILKNPERMSESLMKRILVNSQKEADELIDGLAIDYQEYQDCLETDKQVKEEWARNRKLLSGLEKHDKIAEVRQSKAALESAKERLLETSHSFPNILSGTNQKYGPRFPILTAKLKVFNERLNAPSLVTLGAFDSLTQVNTGLNYLVGQKALAELDLAHYTAEFLESVDFTEISVPNFVRYEVAHEHGLLDHDSQDVYTLQSKAELHQNAGASDHRKVDNDRKEKTEDNYIFQAPGLSETTLYSFFLRRRLPVSMLPLRFFALGNRYRKPHTGMPVQSKVAMLISALSTVKKAEEEFGDLVNIISSFWENLEVPIVLSVVEPHNLYLHEAAAIEFKMQADNWWRSRAKKQLIENSVFPVLSRLSVSYDYVSRRMMTHAKFDLVNDEFCHFVTAELIDINGLLDSLESKY